MYCILDTQTHTHTQLTYSNFLQPPSTALLVTWDKYIMYVMNKIGALDNFIHNQYIHTYMKHINVYTVCVFLKPEYHTTTLAFIILNVGSSMLDRFIKWWL